MAVAVAERIIAAGLIITALTAVAAAVRPIVLLGVQLAERALKAIMAAVIPRITARSVEVAVEAVPLPRV